MKTNGYWVYSITTPDNMVYVGMSGCKTTNRRWNEGYRGTSLRPFIEKFGIENLKKEVIKDGLTKQEAQELEEELRQFYLSKGIVINKQPSGGEWSKLGEKEYRKKHYQEHKEEYSERMKKYRESHKEEDSENHKQYYQEHKEEILNNVKRYYQEHMEEKRKYANEYREKNKELINKKQRERREKKKQQKQLEELGYIPLF